MGFSAHYFPILGAESLGQIPYKGRVNNIYQMPFASVVDSLNPENEYSQINRQIKIVFGCVTNSRQYSKL
jgi:hypothetical protein